MAWMAGAALFVVAMNALVKAANRELPEAMVLFARMALAVPLTLGLMTTVGAAGFATRRPWGHVHRALIGTAAVACFVYALAGMGLAEFVAVSFTRPLWLPLAAWLLLHERLTRPRAIAGIAGFIGVIAMVRPQFAVNAALGIAVLGAVLSSLSVIQVKQLSATEPSSRIVFYFSIAGTVLCAPAAIAQWVTPTGAQLALLFGVAASATGTQYCIARACTVGNAAAIAPVDYVQLPLAVLAGYLMFAERPDAWAILGAIIIIAANLWLARHERQAIPPQP